VGGAVLVDDADMDAGRSAMAFFAQGVHDGVRSCRRLRADISSPGAWEAAKTH
jgi:hypothetical protein